MPTRTEKRQLSVFAWPEELACGGLLSAPVTAEISSSVKTGLDLPFTRRVFCPAREHEAFAGKLCTHEGGFEIGLCTRGKGTLYVNRRFLRYGAGDAVLFFAGAVRGWKSDRGGSCWHFAAWSPQKLVEQTGVDFFSRPLEKAQPAKDFPVLFTKANYLAANYLITHLLNEVLQGEEGYEKRVALGSSMLLMELGHISHLLEEQKQVAEEEIAPIVIYMLQHFNEPITVEQMCMAGNKSYSTLRRDFLKRTGLSPGQYLTHLRLDQAAAMLEETDRKIAEVASYCGFATFSSFNRQFFKRFGCSPREWKTKKRAEM
ncbi:MAG: helix-turn-helix transcriptional regulator [Clostridia bacterium]|nr:helix-turn-helix transcriptional regulator [Clostridia bacterium]